MEKGFRCIFSNQGVWYLDHLDVPWEDVYAAEPQEGIPDASQQKLVLGGEVCMWGETADTSDVQQTIWPRAAAAAGWLVTLYLPQLQVKLHQDLLSFRSEVENTFEFSTLFI